MGPLAQTGGTIRLQAQARRGHPSPLEKNGEPGYTMGAEEAMDTPARAPGTVTLMGSGEMTRSMSKVHRWLVSKIEAPVRAVFLDTPAGFELNADDISARACAYVAEYVGVPCSLASFKAADRASTQETERALRKLRRADYIFAGPGSPTYAARNWRDTRVFDVVAGRVREGAHLVLASAAAIAIGRYTLPVYEIYKVGQEPHWVEGVNLLGAYGLDLAIVSHWNNTEGDTFDTRYCYMGEPRFDVLEKLLPESTAVLGIDEYTACILDLGRDEGRVMGAGQVTIRQRGHEAKFKAGSSFALDELRAKGPAQGVRPRPAEGPDQIQQVSPQARETRLQLARQAAEDLRPSIDEHSDLERVAARVYDLAHALEEAREAGVGEDPLSEGRTSLRQLVIAWGNRLDPSVGDSMGTIDPLLELLVEMRSRLRAAGQWPLADEIRDRLSSLGITLEDAPGKTTWRMP